VLTQSSYLRKMPFCVHARSRNISIPIPGQFEDEAVHPTAVKLEDVLPVDRLVLAGDGQETPVVWTKGLRAFERALGVLRCV